MRLKKGFHLIELLVVLLVLGILVSFAIPVFRNFKDKIYDKEAQSNLVLLRSAQENYRIEMNQYIACDNTSDCNRELGLDLPPADAGWNYSVTIGTDDTTVPPTPTFCGQALKGAYAWHVRHNLSRAYDCDCGAANCTTRCLEAGDSANCTEPE